ncbi:hypothetical protein E4U43_007541 [Claviceps pusilla]|uniref:Uncharacterized protein n=1 Tax=Claviceps pusilla TaxID=123648 RepID=A0A9P7NEK7_9HYPO|nr:hypothetical protein E4U43_007541 [Claviceps pusilla]
MDTTPSSSALVRKAKNPSTSRDIDLEAWRSELATSTTRSSQKGHGWEWRRRSLPSGRSRMQECENVTVCINGYLYRKHPHRFSLAAR